MKDVSLIVCAALAATISFAPMDAATAKKVFKGGCHPWIRAYHDAIKRGDYIMADQAYRFWFTCRAKAAGEPYLNEPLHTPRAHAGQGRRKAREQRNARPSGHH
jgi:hypothetical protein